ncbi:ABC-three component system protein [Rhizobiaceae sp. 2RAB30]
MRAKNTAAPQAAGYILQLERALHHLALAGAGAVVAVEHLDDVTVQRDGKTVLQEQDKSTAAPSAKLLADRGKAIWRTLEIWLLQREVPEAVSCERYLFFVNRPVDTPIATLIKERMRQKATSLDILAALRAQGTPPKKSNAKTVNQAQALIDRVLKRSDEDLIALIDRIEIVEAGDPVADRMAMANGLGLSRRVNADDILDGLFGWLTRLVREEWSASRPGLITREAVLLQKDALQERQARGRLLPRAASDIVVSEADRAGALSRTFVEHLGRIEAGNDDILDAVDHFLKFNAEKHRLVVEGEIADREWGDRGERLHARWRTLMRRHSREMEPRPAREIGQAILADATYEHQEPLDGQPCGETYMTSGHYHRLADENRVWWDPTYLPEHTRED